MDPSTNSYLIEMVKDITISRLSNTTLPVSSEGGKCVADFMQAIYDKLVELDKNAD